MDAPNNSYSSNHHNRWLGRRVVLLLGGLAAALPASLGVGIVASPAASAAQTLSQTFSFNDATQYFTVPAGVTSLGLMAEGGSGGRGAGPGTLYVGGGQAVTETVPVNPGDTLVIEVGGAGGNASGNTGGAAGLSSGDGMNGGAGANTNAGVDGYAGGGGGGGTEVVDATVGRVLVAAGGGGGAGGDASYGGGSGAGTGAAGGDPGSGPYGAGGAGGAYASSGALAGANGNTPSPATLSGGGGGGGGGYFVPSLYGGGGNGGAGGGWVSYESGGGGGGGGDSYSYAPATYGGNTGDAGEVEVSWAAPPTATTTTIAVSPGSVDVNQTYTVDAFVSGNQSNPPTGTVQFSSGGAIIGTAQLVEDEGTDEATFTATAPSAPGTVTWQAQYLGDSGASGSPGDAPSASITASETVEAIVTTETTTTLTADTKTCSVGATCPVTVTVTGIGQPAPSGRVALDSSAIDVPLVLDSAGQATFDYTPESAGSLTWTAEYFGDNYKFPEHLRTPLGGCGEGCSPGHPRVQSGDGRSRREVLGDGGGVGGRTRSHRYGGLHRWWQGGAIGRARSPGRAPVPPPPPSGRPLRRRPETCSGRPITRAGSTTGRPSRRSTVWSSRPPGCRSRSVFCSRRRRRYRGPP